MADGDINYGLGLDISQATAEMAKLKQQLDQLTSSFTTVSTRISSHTNRMVSDLRSLMREATAGSAEYVRLARRLDSARNQQISSQSRGSDRAKIENAAVSQITTELRTTADAVNARIADELVKVFTLKLRNVDKAIDARMRTEIAKVENLIKNGSEDYLRAVSVRGDINRARTVRTYSNPDLINARDTLANYNDQRVIERANNIRQHGTPTAPQTPQSRQNNLDSTLERLGSNGGADIIAIQTRLMIGYQALSVLFNSAKNLSTFVVQLDAEFRQFQAVTATTNSEMGTLKQRLIDVSEQSKFTALEIAQAATTMAQAGLSAREVGDSIGAVSMLATAAGTDLGRAVDVVTSTISIFNLQTSQTVDIANTMTAALNQSKLDIEKLALGLQYSGNIAAQVGMSFQELTGVLGALANSGIRSGSTLGTGLRQLIIDIQNPTKEFTKQLKTLGLAQEDVNVESRGLIPVLKTLQEAGFTTGSAFEAFEVRAASAYAALSNNLDLAAQLQEGFMLSSAAIEANAVQMESFSNTWAKFQSVVGTVAYTAFAPFLDMLQDLTRASADLLSGLNDYPAILTVVGAGIAAIGTGLAVNTLAAAFRGILIGSGALQAFGLSASTAAVEVGVMNAATVTATRSMSVLNIIARANPWIMLATAIATVAVSFIDLSSEAGKAANAVDQVKGEINTINGDIDNTSQQITAIDQAITNLLRQKTELDKDPVLRRAKVLEIVQDFKDLAGSVDVSTTSVQQLTEALNNLKDVDLRVNLGRLENLEISQGDLIQKYRDQLKTAENGTNPYGSYLGAMPYRGLGTADVEKQAMERLTGLLGDKFRDVVNFTMHPTQMPQDPATLWQYQNTVDGTQASLNEELSGLMRDRNRAPSKFTGQKRVEQITEMLKALDVIDEALAPLAKIGFDLAATTRARDNTKAQRVNDAISADAGFRALEKRATDIQTQFETDAADVRRNNKGSALLPALDNLKKKFDEQTAALTADAEKFADDISTRMGASVNPSDAKRQAKSAVDGILAKTRASLTKSIAATVETTSKARDAEFRAQTKTNQSLVDTLLKRSKSSNSIDEVAQIEKSVKDLLDTRRKMINDVFDLRDRAAQTDQEKETLTIERQEALDQVAETETQYVEGFTERAKDIRSDYLRMIQGGIEDQIDALKREINETTDRLKQVQPGRTFDGLRSSINGMIDELGRLQGEQSSVSIQRQAITTGANIPVNQAAASSQAMNFFMQNKLTKEQAAGVVGRLLVESGLSTTIVGDDGQAKGLAQWHPDRYARLQEFAGRDGDATDFMTQLRFVLHELQTTETGAWAMLKSARTPQEASDAMMYYERPGNKEGRPKNYLQQGRPDFGNGYEETVRNANTLFGGDFATQAQTIKDAHREVADASIKATIKDVKEATAAIVKNSTQQVETTVAQAKISGDPEAINKLIASVNTEYGKIIDAKKKAFETENATAIFDGDKEVIAQRDDLLEGLRADQNQKITALMEQYWRAVEEKTEKPIKEAQLALDEAQKPENSSKYTTGDIGSLQDNVVLAERKALVDQVNAAEQLLLRTREQLAAATATYGAGSSEANFWLQQEAEVKQRLVDLTSQKNVVDAAQTRSQYGVGDAIRSANEEWLIQIGLMQRIPGEGLKMVPVAEQVGQAWAEVLPQLSNAFSNLFTNLASGTMSATDALKKFGQDVIGIFMQIIARKLAEQLMASLIPSDGGSGGGFLSTLFQGLFSSPASANGGGIRGAAVGEAVTTGIPNRDSTLRRVMPGEWILRQSAAKAVGKDALEALNNQGNRRMSRQNANDNAAQQGGGVVNVWVVSQDQVPPPGPNDIIATVADNINRRGTLKQLIRQVQMGEV